MKLVQVLLAIPIAVLIALTLRTAARGQMRRRITVFWLTLWSIAALALFWPEGTVMAAQLLGIGRGADLVLYLAVLLGLAGFFYIYTRFRRLDQQITQLVRTLALKDPLQPQPPPAAKSDE